MTHEEELDAAAKRYHAAEQALQAAIDAAIPPDHPLRVEMRAASEALDAIVTDRDFGL